MRFSANAIDKERMDVKAGQTVKLVGKAPSVAAMNRSQILHDGAKAKEGRTPRCTTISSPSRRRCGGPVLARRADLCQEASKTVSMWRAVPAFLDFKPHEKTNRSEPSWFWLLSGALAALGTENRRWNLPPGEKPLVQAYTESTSG